MNFYRNYCRCVTHFGGRKRKKRVFLSCITVTLNTERLLNVGLGNSFDVSRLVLIGALIIRALRTVKNKNGEKEKLSNMRNLNMN